MKPYLRNWLAWHASPWWIVALLLCWPVIEIGVMVHAARPGVVFLMDCRANRACLPSQTLATVGSVKAASAQSYQASRQMEAMATEGVSFLKDAHKGTAGVLAEVQNSTHEAGLLLSDTRKQLDALMGDAQTLTQSLTTDVNDLTARAGRALDPLADALKGITTLEATLDEQIEAGSPKVQLTLDALTKAIADTDKLIASDEIRQTLVHTAMTADHIEHSAESIDIALMPLRKKLTLLKAIAEKALGLVKFTFPL
jgi:hypothetical protein